jgi:bifunctional DNA-binding transcriptional regulator/antitoxin component of YhaV-PrlF toxin-antitoxin module
VIVKTVKVSAKGQLTLPADALRAMNVRKGPEFVLVPEGDRIVLVKAGAVGKRIVDETEGFAALAGRSFARVWDNPVDDEVWNDA